MGTIIHRSSAAAASEMAGRWLSRGYGWALEVGETGFVVRDISAAGSSEADRGPPGSLPQAFDPIVRESPATLKVKHRGDVTAYWFDRVQGSESDADRAALVDDPLVNYDALWRLFQDHYAFFDLRGVDWRAAYGPGRDRLGATSTEADLFEAAGALIAPLADAHVSIAAGEKVLDVTSPIRERKARLVQAFGVPPWSRERQAYTHGLQAAWGEMFLGSRFRATTNRMMIYGEIAPGVGYLTLFGEFGHADTPRARAALDLPRPRLEAAAFLADEIEALRRSLDEVVAALAPMTALIVDVRLNYGGYDRLALDFAARFADRPRAAYAKKTWFQGAVVAQQRIAVTPRGPSLSHLPVFLLTSRQTASAGEILVLAMRALPNVTTVGEATLGILSDNLYKRLPNGWEVSLSNEIYEAPGGALYEGCGIPPDVGTPVYDPTDIRAGLRRAVDRAVQLARAVAG
jgi:carboxyl-terminal processing protease